MPVEDSGIWPTTTGIEEEEGQWKEGEWSIEGEESRRFMNIQII